MGLWWSDEQTISYYDILIKVFILLRFTYSNAINQ